MTDAERFIAGEGSLTYGRVLREALGMFRTNYARVAIVAVFIFVPPPLIAATLEGLRQSLEVEAGLMRELGYLAGLLLVTMFRLLGPVVYAGYLDEAVGHAYFHGTHKTFGHVLRTLPWGRLLVADVILVVGSAIGLALFVVPGVVFLTLFALVGPVIVQEGHGVSDGLRRTFGLSRSAWPMILVLVVALLAAESAAHEILHQAFHHSALGLQITASWAVAVIIGGMIGLIEVAMATELMARHPIEDGAG